MELDQINIENIRRLVADKLTEPILRLIESSACAISSEDVEYKKPVNKSTITDWSVTADRIVENLESRGFSASYEFNGFDEDSYDPDNDEPVKPEIVIVVVNQWC